VCTFMPGPRTGCSSIFDKEGERDMVRIKLTIPKRVGRKQTQVTAILDDWTAVCDDATIAARLEAIKPDWTHGYLPPPTMEWARQAARIMHARIVSFDQTEDGPRFQAVLQSGGRYW